MTSAPKATLTLRRKFVIAFTGLAFFVAALVGGLGYSFTEHGLRGEIDRSLVTVAQTLSTGGTVATSPPAGPSAGAGDGGERGPARDQGIVQAAQRIAPDGTVTVLTGTQLPVTTGSTQLQSAPAGARIFGTILVGDKSYRTLSQSLGPGGGTIQVARDLAETVNVLRDLAFNLVKIGLGVLLAAAGLGWLVARQITRRLTSLTAAAEHVSSTGFLDVDITTRGHDEVARLGAAMQAMLGELARSRDDQQRLVQDAGHELRTPLTSLRTNVSVLRRFAELSPGSRSRLLDDVEGETRELTNLVNELVELATDGRDAEDFEQVDLGEVAERVAALFRRRTGREIAVDVVRPAATILAKRHSVERALSNLAENSLKFDPDDAGPVEIQVRGRTVTVSDRGPGLVPAEVERIFDRFYRATEARSMPGSGLGLSIVRDVAVAHGGTVTAANRPGGGAVIGFTLGEDPG